MNSLPHVIPSALWSLRMHMSMFLYLVGFPNLLAELMNTSSNYKISFTSWAGMLVIQNIQLTVMPDRVEIVPTAEKLM